MVFASTSRRALGRRRAIDDDGRRRRTRGGGRATADDKIEDGRRTTAERGVVGVDWSMIVYRWGSICRVASGWFFFRLRLGSEMDTRASDLGLCRDALGTTTDG